VTSIDRDAPADARLLSRYRLFLAAYPQSYRDEREEELLGVLMDGSAPDQRRPSAADAIDLVRAGLVTRWRAGRGLAAPTPWRSAIAIVTVLLPVLLAVRVLRPVGVLIQVSVGEYAWDWHPYTDSLFQGWQAPALWSLVCVAVVLRRRLAAAALATAAATAELVYVIVPARGPQAYAVHGRITWLVLELIAAGLLWRRDAVARGLTLLGRRSLLAASVGAALVYASVTDTLYGVALHRVLTPLGMTVGLLLLVSVAWVRRSMLRSERMWLRLAMPALGVEVAVLVGGQMQRHTNTSQSAAKGLLVQFALTFAAVGLVAAVTVAATWVARRWHLEWRIAPRSR
jgi:hypothetical protein